MKRILLIILANTILILTVPWFPEIGPNNWFGLPNWVVLSFTTTLIYGLLIGGLLQYEWNTKNEEKQ
jgi:hypothetical protein